LSGPVPPGAFGKPDVDRSRPNGPLGGPLDGPIRGGSGQGGNKPRPDGPPGPQPFPGSGPTGSGSDGKRPGPDGPNPNSNSEKKLGGGSGAPLLPAIPPKVEEAPNGVSLVHSAVPVRPLGDAQPAPPVPPHLVIDNAPAGRERSTLAFDAQTFVAGLHLSDLPDGVSVLIADCDFWPTSDALGAATCARSTATIEEALARAARPGELLLSLALVPNGVKLLVTAYKTEIIVADLGVLGTRLHTSQVTKVALAAALATRSTTLPCPRYCITMRRCCAASSFGAQLRIPSPSSSCSLSPYGRNPPTVLRRSPPRSPSPPGL
ncbi:hypothetical protein HK405_012890, partial [Cladochytrium tenue]